MVSAESLVSAGARQIQAVADRPFSEARLLLAYCADCDPSDIIVRPDKEIPDAVAQKYFSCIEKRAQAVPMAYITHRQFFYSLPFAVEPGVLIPRPETELLVEYILSVPAQRLLDVCTGSGCIPVAAAFNRPELQCVAVDLSDTAISTARQNAGTHGVADRVVFLQADAADPRFSPPGQFDIIVSNPPYLRSSEIDGLMPDVRLYEPHMALDGGADGLAFYRRICEFAPRFLLGSGILAFEIGQGPEADVRRLMAVSFEQIGCLHDLAGIPRVLFGTKKTR